MQSSSEWLLKGNGHDKYFRQDVIMISALLSTGLLNRLEAGMLAPNERVLFAAWVKEES